MLEELAEVSLANNVFLQVPKIRHVQDNGKLGWDRSWSISQVTKCLCNKAQLDLSLQYPGLFQTPHHKPDQVPPTKNQMIAFHAGVRSKNVQPWKTQAEVAAAIVSVGEERKGRFAT